MKMRWLSNFTSVALTFALCVPTTGWGSSGREGASFLNIPVGARPAALGSGYSALATDAYAPTWNSAGLGFVDETQLAGQHLSYLESIHYEYLSFVHPFSPGKAFGSSLQYLGSGDIAGTDAGGSSIGAFSSHFAAYTLAYGQTLTDQVSLGVTGKWINAKIADVSANAFAVDFGSLYKVTHKLNLAATIANIGNKLTFLTQGDSLPLAFHLGGAYALFPRMTVNGEFEYQNSGLASWHMGAEWSPMAPVALRIGYRTDTLKELSALAGLTLGIGLKVFGQEFSYAWLPYGELGNTQYFSLTFRFGQGAERKGNLIQFNRIEKHEALGTPEDSQNDLMTSIEHEMKERVAQGDETDGRSRLNPTPAKMNSAMATPSNHLHPGHRTAAVKYIFPQDQEASQEEITELLLDSPTKAAVAKSIRPNSKGKILKF